MEETYTGGVTGKGEQGIKDATCVAVIHTAAICSIVLQRHHREPVEKGAPVHMDIFVFRCRSGFSWTLKDTFIWLLPPFSFFILST